MPGEIDVIIPTFGGWPLTRSCLEHLRGQSVPCRVTVVDNGSPDETVKMLRSDFPEVKVIEMGENAGFARACNEGILAGSGEVVVLLNNDVDAAPDLLEKLASPFASDRLTGSAAPMLIRPDGRIDSVGLCADRTLAGFPRFAGDAPSQGNGLRPTLLGPSGACGAYRRTALEQVGLLDENIFMYQEDLDLALRLDAAGWRSVGVSAARGVHRVSATIGARSSLQRERAGFARGYLLRKFGVMSSTTSVRATVTEVIVCLADAARSGDLASIRGRFSGWRSGPLRTFPTQTLPGVDNSIGIIQSMRLRARGQT